MTFPEKRKICAQPQVFGNMNRLPGAPISKKGLTRNHTKCQSSMSAFAVAIGGKADMLFALQMSAFDPKRTLSGAFPEAGLSRYDALP